MLSTKSSWWKTKDATESIGFEVCTLVYCQKLEIAHAVVSFVWEAHSICSYSSSYKALPILNFSTIATICLFHEEVVWFFGVVLFEIFIVARGGLAFVGDEVDSWTTSIKLHCHSLKWVTKIKLSDVLLILNISKWNINHCRLRLLFLFRTGRLHLFQFNFLWRALYQCLWLWLNLGLLVFGVVFNCLRDLSLNMTLFEPPKIYNRRNIILPPHQLNQIILVHMHQPMAFLAQLLTQLLSLLIITA